MFFTELEVGNEKAARSQPWDTEDVLLSPTIRMETLAYLMYVIENTGQKILDKSNSLLVGVPEARTRQFCQIFLAG